MHGPLRICAFGFRCLHCGFAPRLRERESKRRLASHPLACFILHSTSLDYCVFMCHLPPACWAQTPQRATHSLATRPIGARPPCAALCTRERDRVLHCVYLAWARRKRCVTDDARLKHRQAVLSNLLYSHLPLRCSSADEEHSSSTPATLAAACDVMRFRPSSSYKPLRQAPHHLILGALGGRPGVGE